MKPLPVGGGVAVDEGDDERVAVGMPFGLVASDEDIAVVEFIGIRVLL